jgi:hypothetical protein
MPMRLTMMVAFVAVLVLGGVVYALVSLSTDVRQVAKNVEALTGVMRVMSQDVSVLATDVQDIADAIAGEPEAEETAPCPPRRDTRQSRPIRHRIVRARATHGASRYQVRAAADR